MNGEQVGSVVSVVGLVNRDLGGVVREAAAIGSPYFAHGRMDVLMQPLVERLTLLEDRRPELFAELAERLGVGEADVVAEVQVRGHNLLMRALTRRWVNAADHELEPRRTTATAQSGQRLAGQWHEARAATVPAPRAGPGQAASSATPSASPGSSTVGPTR